nr:putative receptor protein kinase ZmPK1 [Tanacetum cinerariifolium]
AAESPEKVVAAAELPESAGAYTELLLPLAAASSEKVDAFAEPPPPTIKALDFIVRDKSDVFVTNKGNMAKMLAKRRFYSLNDSSGLWSVSWQAIAQPINIHGLCGRNGICIHGEKLECVCPPGYERDDPTDLSQGCKPYFNKTCVDSTEFKFVEMLYTDYYGFDLNFSSPISFEACRDICLGDCYS